MKTMTTPPGPPRPVALICLLVAATLAGVGCSREAVPEAAPIVVAETPPEAVLETWKAFGGGSSSPGEVEQETEHGLETWSAELEGPTGMTEVTALADGTLVSIENEVAAGEVPVLVLENAARVLGATPAGVERVRLAVWELEDRTPSGDVRERFIDPFGNVLVTRIVVPGSETEVAETLEELPPAARAALERESGGAVLSSLQKEWQADREVHAAEWQASDGPRELKVLPDGSVLSLELPTGPLPERVATLVRIANEASAEEEVADDDGEANVERMLLDAWEAEVLVGDIVRQALILPTGEILGSVTSEAATADETD